MAERVAACVAAVQMTSRQDVGANLDEASGLIHEAASAGARLVALPENFACMPRREIDRRKLAETPGHGRVQDFLSTQARSFGIWLVGGTIPMASGSSDDRPASACLVYDSEGRLVGRYDKIHLFDVDIPGAVEQYRESEQTAPGTEVVALETPIGHLGLAVCYDLRFPEQFRRLAEAGSELICVPSAFTAVTGRAHWEVLVRARAIENQCEVIAPAQAGVHENGRETHGDTMIVDHWGRVLNRRAQGPGIVVAELDREKRNRVRECFPVLAHRRLGTSKD